MSHVRLSSHYGIVIRRASLKLRSVSLEDILQAMEVQQPMDQDEHLISFGPHFGQEAADELIKRLKQLGLEYYDDYFDFNVDIPEWCSLYIKQIKE